MKLISLKRKNLATSKMPNVIKAGKFLLGLTPVGVFCLYLNQMHQYNKYMSYSESVDGSDALLESTTMPTTYDAYQEWIQSASEVDLIKYNQVLSDVKKQGKCSEQFLQENNFVSTEDFKEKFAQLYELGKNGDLEAQGKFNLLQNAYQDDFFYQASLECATKPKFGFSLTPEETVSGLTTETVDDFTGTLILIGGLVVCGIIGIKLCSKIMKKNKENENTYSQYAFMR